MHKDFYLVKRSHAAEVKEKDPAFTGTEMLTQEQKDPQTICRQWKLELHHRRREIKLDSRTGAGPVRVNDSQASPRVALAITTDTEGYSNIVTMPTVSTDENLENASADDVNNVTLPIEPIAIAASTHVTESMELQGSEDPSTAGPKQKTE